LADKYPMRLKEFLPESSYRAPPGAIHVADGLTRIYPHLAKQYPEIKPFTGTIYDNPKHPDYYNTADFTGYVPPRDPVKQRGWWRDPWLTPKSWVWASPEQKLQGYRADQRPGRSGLEDQPLTLNKTDVLKALTAYKKGVEAKLIEPISPLELVALMFAEGRGDLGFNAADVNQPRVGQVARAAAKLGLTSGWENFVAGIYEKQQVAARLNIPFYQAWQGGTKHVNRFNLNVQAAQDPKNAQLLAWVKQNMGYREPEPAELAQAQANPPQEQEPL